MSGLVLSLEILLFPSSDYMMSATPCSLSHQLLASVSGTVHEVVLSSTYPCDSDSVFVLGVSLAIHSISTFSSLVAVNSLCTCLDPALHVREVLNVGQSSASFLSWDVQAIHVSPWM